MGARNYNKKIYKNEEVDSLDQIKEYNAEIMRKFTKSIYIFNLFF